jgi:hypothetical protein
VSLVLPTTASLAHAGEFALDQVAAADSFGRDVDQAHDATVG